MYASRKGERLGRRYPILATVPESERPAVVRAALRHPLLLASIVGAGLLLLPVYFDFAFRVTGAMEARNTLLQLSLVAGCVLAPIILIVPLLSRFIVPSFIRREMKKRGYSLPES